MAIVIIDNFQVDINNPIDNRFVVGSQSIPSGSPSLYPTPFYAYKEDIIYKYPGLRIWDFNDNVPYFWNGTQWINENTTGAIVENAATGDTGFMNYLAKFKNNTTLLTKGLVYDTGTHIGIGLTGSSIVPDVSGAPGSFGLHVLGNIRTNGVFVGRGRLINYLNLDTTTTGVLELPRIKAPGTPPPTGFYLLKNTNGIDTGTQWDLSNNIIPSGTNLIPITTGIGITTGGIFGELNTSNQYTFKTIVSTGLQITENTNDIRIETKQGINLGSGDAIQVYANLDSNNIHQFRKLKSNSLKIYLGTGADDGNIIIESPITGSTRALYVNMTYTPTYDDWKRAYDAGKLTTSADVIGPGYYRGDGTLARPFTDSIKYDLSGTLIDTKIFTSIQNGLDFYINKFGTVVGTKSVPSFSGELLTIQGGVTYFFSGDFSINYLRLKIEAINVISTTTGFLIDLDDTSIFPQSSQATIIITIEKDCQLEIRGSLDPDNNYLGGAGVFFGTPLTLRQGGRGFRCSGTDISTTNYSGNLHQLVFRGDGYITSLYKPQLGSTGTFPSRSQRDNLFLFNLDENNNLLSNNAPYVGAPTDPNNPGKYIGFANDGHICIQVDCNITAPYQGIYMIGGRSKLEFTKLISHGLLTNNLYDESQYLHDNDCFYAKGGLVRFFDTNISVGNGKRKSVFIIEPNLTKQYWTEKDDYGQTTGGDYYPNNNGSSIPGSVFYPYGNVTGSIPFLIFRNCRLGGPAKNWFDKRTSGVSFVDMVSCTTLYFSGDRVVKTSSTGAPGGGENWLGSIDQRWGCQWNPSQGWDPARLLTPLNPTAPNVSIRDPKKYNGTFNLRNNIIEYIKIDTQQVDLTISNGQSVVNTVGGQVINSLQKSTSVSSALINNIQSGSQFIMYSSSSRGITASRSYMIDNPGPTSAFSSNWYSKGYNQTILGIPSSIKMFTATASTTLTGTASAYEIRIEYIP